MKLFEQTGEHAEVIHALVIVESGENPAVRGDGDRAQGLLQCHPSTFAEYYGKCPRFPRNVSHTWAEAEILTCASFLEMWMGLGLDAAVQAWNIGVSAYITKGKRNPEYLAKFSDAYQLIRSGAHASRCKLGGG